MTPIEESAEDLWFAFHQLRDAGGREPEHRRALKAVLNELYLVREYRRAGGDENGPYRKRAAAEDGGKVTQGLIFVRGFRTHDMAKRVEPQLQPLYPPFYPSQDTFPGANFIWITDAELQAIRPTQENKGKDEYPSFKTHVAGQMMLSALRQAITFLLQDPIMVTLGRQ